MSPRCSAAALLAALVACAAPSQYDPAAFGSFTVAVGPSLDGVYDWQPAQRAALESGLLALRGLGPGVALTTEGAADVVVRAASLGGDCGAFRQGLAYVEADAACASQRGGMGFVVQAAAHEVVHWWTWRRWGAAPHVCDWPVGAAVPPGCHPDVRCPGGGCLMSPGLARVDGGPGFSEAYSGDAAVEAPQAPDLALARRCLDRGGCT